MDDTRRLSLSSRGQQVKAKLTEIFGADLRSLAALRIILALLVLVDLSRRATDLVAHYSDAGILPRSELALGPYSFSLNTLSGSPEFQALLFALAALSALSMLVGYRTRLSIFVVWLLVLSIQLRNPLVLIGGDTLLHLLLFWSIFLPLGAVWSVDRVRRGIRFGMSQRSPRPLSMRFFSMGTVALFLQIAIMYWVTAIHKSGEEWRWDGTAIYYALSYERGATELGGYLLNFPVLLTVMTFATLTLEALGPFLLFSPVFNSQLRTATAAAFMGLHFGILTTLTVGLFSLYAALCMVCFLPGWFWDGLLPKLHAGLAGVVHALRPRERRGSLSPQGAERLGILGLWGSTTALAVGADRPSSGGVSTAPEHGGGVWTEGADEDRSGQGPADANTAGRDRLARREAMNSRPMVLRSALVTNLLALGLLLNVVGWNLASVSPLGLPTPAYQVSSVLGLSQSWYMFAPAPPKEDGWWVAPGELAGGEQVDLMSVIHEDYRLQEVSYEKPGDIGASVKNWQKYLNQMTTTEFTDTPQRQSEQREHRESFSRYLCREWNEKHAGAESLRSLKLVYMKETTPPPGQSAQVEKVNLYQHSCN